MRWGDSRRGSSASALSSLLAIAISHVLFYTAVQHLGATLATGGHLLGPFITLGLASTLLGERLAPAEWAAGAAMVAGAGLLILAQERLEG